MADDDAPPTASASAPRSAWVDDPPFPPLPRDLRRVSPAEVVVEAVAVRLAEGPAEAAPPQHRTANQRRATPAEHLLMLRRYDDENPQEQFRLDVMQTCIAAAYPDAVAGDVRYVSALKWLRMLEVMKPGDESSGGVLSDASKRSVALARLHAEVEHAKQKVAEALVKKLACEARARIAASKVAESAAKRAAKIAQETAQRSQEEARRSRAQSAHAAAAGAPQEMPRAMGSGVHRSADVDAVDHGQEELRRAAPARPKNRVKQLPYHVELMGGPAGRNETETGDLTSMTRQRKRELCCVDQYPDIIMCVSTLTHDRVENLIKLVDYSGNWESVLVVTINVHL
jgi:hypothetical protein